MKLKGVIIVLVLMGCSTMNNSGADPHQLKQKKIYILAQIDSISRNNHAIFFTSIESYTNIPFKANNLNTEGKSEVSEFYKKLLLNHFKSGYFKTKPNKVRKIKKQEIYLLLIDVLGSSQDMLFVEDVVKPDKVELSKMTILN